MSGADVRAVARAFAIDAPSKMPKAEVIQNIHRRPLVAWETNQGGRS